MMDMSILNTNYSELYILEDPINSSYLRLDFAEIIQNMNQFLALFRGEVEIDEPIKFKKTKGGNLSDVLWSTLPPFFVISTKLRDIFVNNGLTGWKTYEIEIIDRELSTKTEYWGFSCTGKVGEQDISKGKILIKPPPRIGGKSYKVLKGMYFKDDYWDGSDFCVLGYGGGPIVSDKVVKVFNLFEIENIKFLPLSEYEIDIKTLEITGEWPLANKSDLNRSP